MDEFHGKSVTIVVAVAIVVSLAVACQDSIDSGASGLVPRPSIDLSGSWTGVWEFTTCNAGSRVLMPCNDDSDCDGLEGACTRPAAMCNEGEYTERACLSDADCPDDAVGGVPGPPIAGACEVADYGGTIELDLVQGAPYLLSPSEYAAPVSGSSLFEGSPCWNPARWDPNDPNWGNGTYPWDPPIFAATLVGTEVDEARVFQLNGDNAYDVTGTPERVPNVLLATVEFVALGDMMMGPLSVGTVPRNIGFKGGFLNPSSPYDPALYDEANVCVGRLGNASVSRN